MTAASASTPKPSYIPNTIHNSNTMTTMFTTPTSSMIRSEDDFDVLGLSPPSPPNPHRRRIHFDDDMIHLNGGFGCGGDMTTDDEFKCEPSFTSRSPSVFFPNHLLIPPLDDDDDEDDNDNNDDTDMHDVQPIPSSSCLKRRRRMESTRSKSSSSSPRLLTSRLHPRPRAPPSLRPLDDPLDSRYVSESSSGLTTATTTTTTMKIDFPTKKNDENTLLYGGDDMTLLSPKVTRVEHGMVEHKHVNHDVNHDEDNNVINDDDMDTIRAVAAAMLHQQQQLSPNVIMGSTHSPQKYNNNNNNNTRNSNSSKRNSLRFSNRGSFSTFAGGDSSTTTMVQSRRRSSSELLFVSIRDRN